ncbi:VOC family protein [Bordetella flabilis]|uniref:Lactoylglutathione lyase n=1 Tax=Bordetella flabilis TaxID=463014 RepID=A0A193GDH6_9BORD|nr:VOC family protein [Bordetella flabilis]ANN77511.1 lactoylglutathione lyase [Bordetella flabilis]
MNYNPGRWFEIYVQDMDRARRFYETVLDATFEKLDAPGMEMYAFPMSMEEPGIAGALVCMPGVPSGGNSTLIYFGCDDCSVEAARVAKAGGRVDKEKMSIGQYGYIALAYDTEGNMFGLHSMQ